MTTDGGNFGSNNCPVALGQLMESIDRLVVVLLSLVMATLMMCCEEMR